MLGPLKIEIEKKSQIVVDLHNTFLDGVTKNNKLFNFFLYMYLNASITNP